VSGEKPALGPELRQHGLRPSGGALGAIARRDFLRALGLAIPGGALWLAGCSGDDHPSPTSAATPAPPSRGGTLKLGQSADLNLAAGYPFSLVSQNRILAYAAHETLIQYRNSLTPELVLAERFEVTPDFRRAIVSLPPDIQFHNGATMTSEDVAFSVQTVRDPASAGLPTTVQFELAGFARTITDIKLPDSRTVEFTFDQPRVNIPDFFAQLHIAQKATFGEIAQGRVFGTGPFMLASWDKGQRYRVERFPNWHGAGTGSRPYLDAIEVTIFPDQNTAVTAFKAGTLDCYLAVSAPNAASVAVGQTRLTGKTGMNYLGMNVSNPLLQDARVRQAIFYALDRNVILTNAAQGFGKVTTQPWATTSPAFEIAREVPMYDPQRAKTLLAQAGFQQDRDLVIEYAAGSALQELQAQLIQDELKAIDLRTQLQAVDPTQYTLRYRNREFPDFWVASHPSGDLTPLTLFQQTFEFRTDSNASHYQNARYTDLVNGLATVAPKSPEAQDLYHQLNQLMLDDPFVIPTGIPQVRIDLVQDKVAGWPAAPDDYAITVAGKVDLGAVWLR
jgi:peptide/nickel transport system substrate-binding protein